MWMQQVSNMIYTCEYVIEWTLHLLSYVRWNLLGKMVAEVAPMLQRRLLSLCLWQRRQYSHVYHHEVQHSHIQQKAALSSEEHACHWKTKFQLMNTAKTEMKQGKTHTDKYPFELHTLTAAKLTSWKLSRWMKDPSQYSTSGHVSDKKSLSSSLRRAGSGDCTPPKCVFLAAQWKNLMSQSMPNAGVKDLLLLWEHHQVGDWRKYQRQPKITFQTKEQTSGRVHFIQYDFRHCWKKQLQMTQDFQCCLHTRPSLKDTLWPLYQLFLLERQAEK